MKMAAKISLLLNLILIGALMFVWKRSQMTTAVSEPPSAPRFETRVQAAAVVAAPPAPHVVERVASPFRWSQLLPTSEDYRGFVANLRASGCPEPTVEAIVRGETEQAFDYMRGRLGIAGTDPGPWSVESQMKMADYLLGQKPAFSVQLTAAGPSDKHQAGLSKLEGFLQTVDLTGPGASDEQKQEIASLRDNLLEQFSGPNQAPTGPDNLAFSSGADNTQPSQAGADGRPPWWRPPSQSLLMGEEAEGMIGGLFGIGAAIRYDQFKAAHLPPQN
jgi:hypothetical protein